MKIHALIAILVLFLGSTVARCDDVLSGAIDPDTIDLDAINPDELALDVMVADAIDPASINIVLGDATPVPTSVPGVPLYRFCPDGHVTVLSTLDSSGNRQMEMYWAGSSSYRTVGTSFTKMKLNPTSAVISLGRTGQFDNGGAWLYSVYPVTSTQYIGFYHAEDHNFDTGRSAYYGWKSAALCTSQDSGMTWQKQGQILTSSHQKPSTPGFGGCGDFCVVFDPASNRWFCFYAENFLGMAVSTDPQARPGTWKKWNSNTQQFDVEGLGGDSDHSFIVELKGKSGGNPSIHYNTFLDCWIMVWHTWGTENLMYSSSQDLIHWSPPVTLLEHLPGEKVWYPTIVGSTDTLAGEHATLLYGYWPDETVNVRHFLQRPVTFVIE